MLPPFSHSPRHTNATRIALASVEANGENNSLKGGDERPHSQSGYTLGQFTECQRALWKSSWSSSCCRNTFPLWPAVIFIFHHSRSLWRRLSADGVLATTCRVRSQEAERSQWTNECSTPKTMLLLSRHTGMRGHERTRPLPLLGTQLRASFFTLSFFVWSIVSLLSLRKSFALN